MRVSLAVSVLCCQVLLTPRKRAGPLMAGSARASIGAGGGTRGLQYDQYIVALPYTYSPFSSSGSTSSKKKMGGQGEQRYDVRLQQNGYVAPLQGNRCDDGVMVLFYRLLPPGSLAAAVPMRPKVFIYQ